MTAFSLGAFQSTCYRVQTKLTELKYIDDARDYLFEITNTNVTIGDWGMLMGREVRLGWTVDAKGWVTTPEYPDVDDGYVSLDQATSGLSTVSTEAYSYASGRIDQWESGLEPITKPYAPMIRTAAETLDSIQSTIENDNAIQTGTTGWGMTTERWQGTAADAFHRNFVNPFSQVVDNHRLAAAQASAVLFATLDLVNAHQTTVMNYIEGVEALLDEQLELRAAESEGILGSTFGLVGRIVSATGVGAGIGTAVGIISGGMSLVAGVLPSEAQPETIEASSATEIASRLNSRWPEQASSFQDGLDTIGEAAQGVYDLSESDADDGLLFPPAPTIVDASPEEFHHQSSEQYA
jgi:hypothetical protein